MIPTDQERSGLGNEDEKKNNLKLRNGSFSRTFSKSNLLAKIRNAMGQRGNQLTTNVNLDGMEKKTPRRFIVKRSQERGVTASLQNK